jgi:plastocyanin
LRALAPILTVLALLAAVGVAAAGAAGTKTTGVYDDYFAKPKLTISKGTVVVWKWRATSDPHTVTDVKKRFGSKQSKKGSFSHKFAKSGTYTVYCKVHPTVMRQTIVVR